jgi:hypothetical protein
MECQVLTANKKKESINIKLHGEDEIESFRELLSLYNDWGIESEEEKTPTDILVLNMIEDLDFDVTR